MDIQLPTAETATHLPRIELAYKLLLSKVRGRAVMELVRGIIKAAAFMDQATREDLAVLLVAGLIEPGTTLNVIE
jgi:hypothetical protein